MMMMAAAPMANLLLSYRLKHGKEHLARFGERRGESTLMRPDGPLVWVHGASVGEIASIIPLVDRIGAKDFRVLVPSGTVTSATLGGQWLPRGLIHQFLPLDSPPFVERFLGHWRPD